MSSGNNDFAEASPTKKFFVSMLTRDIDLADAILDLVDNCLDGALRLAAGGDVDYAQHWVKIYLSEARFLIEDNCGGIPRDVAKNYAFKMGRALGDGRDSESETIGMYGVGMKRAIFKMGRNALVRTRHEDDTFEVPISSDWLDDPKWNPLPIRTLETSAEELDVCGTTIEVSKLYEGVSRHFGNIAFENEVRTAISEHFTTFLQRGLNIEINDVAVKPVLVEVLVDKDDDGPAPYVFRETIDGVLVSIVVGMNTGRPMSSDDDYDDNADFDEKRKSRTAGWTIFCNDRAVIVGDKSRLTGWGDGMPMYHDQYIVITGIIEFRAADAEKLPVTTTKRALDTSSNVWLESLVKMKEGIRLWITYTNQWKNHPRADQTGYWENAVSRPLEQVIEIVSSREGARISDSGKLEFNPKKVGVLPKPKSKKPSSRRVVFSRPIEEVRLVSKLLFDTDDEKPGVVGDRCFEEMLLQAKEQEDCVMASGSSIPYRLRPNKAADRELFLSLLMWLAPVLGLRNYHYIGLGGPFLEDFRLVHARLGITRMTSLEVEEQTHLRQYFNRPTESIECLHESLEGYLDSQYLDDDDRIIWFDYTRPASIASQIERFAQTVGKVTKGSILRITLNANPSALGRPKYDEVSSQLRVGSGNSGKPSIQEWRLDKFKERLGEMFPSGLESSGMTHKEFGKTILKVLEIAVAKELLSCSDRSVKWAFSTHYADGQPMVTATLVVCEVDDELEDVVDSWEFHSKLELPHILDLPPLSTLERLTMESHGDPRTSLGFDLPKSDMSSDPFDTFERFYRMYPHFSRVHL